MTHRFGRAAELEMLQASLWYEAQRPGLGTEFAQEVDAGIKIILDGPGRWAEVKAGVRKYRINRFPYGLFYRIDGDEVEIVAVADLRRRPGYWRSRLP